MVNSFHTKKSFSTKVIKIFIKELGMGELRIGQLRMAYNPKCDLRSHSHSHSVLLRQLNEVNHSN